ncbi:MULTISPECIES: sigma-70 family RNA polymerase sigma factor [Actinomyces]|uniref:Sigma-70 family RNA polymerase sigma factor n=1 Tax=Actinomyces marmotae TaxID=2737173 RepID=A0A6M8AXH1_9ACTO|nr:MULTISPECIES: sigma-70 family RNA polymerase sigma factor [Actinomyces]QKD79119.1 sigma-70 family RNA polymerase sigma factor [Actinomyces marmotae]
MRSVEKQRRTEHGDEADALLGRVAQGDENAFAELYDAWAGRLLALIIRIVIDRSQSEEVLQEVMLEAWRRAPSFDPSRGTGRAWLVTMARHRAIDRVRSSQAARDREDAWQGYLPDSDVTAAEVEDRMEAGRVRDALDAVGEPHRTTIALAYFTGLTHTEIAERMGVPLGTVKSRIRDGMAKMRAHLGEQR